MKQVKDFPVAASSNENMKLHSKFRFPGKRKDHNLEIEDALRDSELKFRTLFNSAGNAIFIMKDGLFTDCNQKALEVFGCPKEKIIGETFHRFAPPEQPEGNKSQTVAWEKMNAAAAGYPQIFEWICLRCDSIAFWGEVSLNRFELNRQLYILAIIRDITSRKKAEKALQNSEERYRALFEGANEGILVADIETKRYVMTNPAAQQMLGYDPEEMKSMGLWDIYPKESQKMAISRVSELVRGEKSLVTDIPCSRKDGTVFFADFKAYWAMIDTRECLVCFFTDVSERKDALQKLKESEERLRTIMNSLQVGVVIIDAETRTVTDANPAAAQMVGTSRENVIGTPCHRYVCPEDQTSCPILDQGQEFSNSEQILVKESGEEIPILKTVSRISLWGRDYLLESFIDISEKKKLEAQLMHAQKMEAVGRLAGGIAHDFNNLLMAIMGHTELVLMKMDAHDPQRRRLEEIKKAGQRATALTGQLLAFSRKQLLKPEIVNLNKIVSGAESMLKRIIGEDIQFISSFHPHLHKVKADAGQIDQVILNLAVNARDAMPKGGELIIETENVTIDDHFCRMMPEAQAGEFVCLSIADSGKGMSEEIAEKIFEPFFTTKDSGTGLGLSVVYGIVKQHGGWIKVYTAPGIGSNFQVFFPVATGNLEEVEKDETVTGDLTGNGEHILVVEDEESVRCVTVDALIENGYRVTEAGSAQEAMAAFKKENGDFNLIFCDIVLPDETGLILVERLIALNPALRILLTSGYPGNKSIWSDISKKGYLFIQKPFTLTALLSKVKETLKRELHSSKTCG